MLQVAHGMEHRLQWHLRTALSSDDTSQNVTDVAVSLRQAVKQEAAGLFQQYEQHLLAVLQQGAEPMPAKDAEVGHASDCCRDLVLPSVPVCPHTSSCTGRFCRVDVNAVQLSLCAVLLNRHIGETSSELSCLLAPRWPAKLCDLCLAAGAGAVRWCQGQHAFSGAAIR